MTKLEIKWAIFYYTYIIQHFCICTGRVTILEHKVLFQSDLSYNIVSTQNVVPPTLLYTDRLLSSFRAYSAEALLCTQCVTIHLQAVAKPKFRGPRSVSIARNQVWLRSGFSTANQTPISLIADQNWKMIADQVRVVFPSPINA